MTDKPIMDKNLKAPFPYFGGKGMVADLVWSYLGDVKQYKDVEVWCLERGGNPNYRIVVAGYDDEYKTLLNNGWIFKAWSTGGGYSTINSAGAKNRHRERLFISPHCLVEKEKMLW